MRILLVIGNSLVKTDKNDKKISMDDAKNISATRVGPNLLKRLDIIDELKKSQDELKKSQDELKKSQDELKKSQDELKSLREIDALIGTQKTNLLLKNSGFNYY